MRIEIVVIGNELLDGSRVDQNTAYIAARLTEIGAEVVRSVVVPDDPRRIEEALKSALLSADAVVSTGGLGVTTDDRTKQVAARLVGARLALDERVLARVRERFEARGVPMPQVNVSQAMVPAGARVIDNDHGTAPGLLIEKEGVPLFVLPGVPVEMKAMIDGYVVPFLEGRGLRRLSAVRLVRTTGIPESRVAELVEPVAPALVRTELAYLPSRAGVDLKIVTKAATLEEAVRIAEESAERIAERLEPYVYARGDQTIEEVLGYLLTMSGKTVAVAESCTGGRVGWRITRVAGSSAYFLGGVIAYSNALKVSLLGVRDATLSAYGAVSEETAREMALGVRSRAGSDYGLAVTGIAGPDGGTPEKPVGLVYVAVAGSEVRIRRLRFLGGRDAVREHAAQAALELLRRSLLGIAEE